MFESNKKYGRLISDATYIQRVIQDMQDKINEQKDSGEYSEDGMKGIIMDELDDLEIYPEDVDNVFSELEF